MSKKDKDPVIELLTLISIVVFAIIFLPLAIIIVIIKWYRSLKNKE